MTVGRVWSVLDSKVVTRAIQVVAVASLLLAVSVAGKQYSLTDCLARYQDRSAKATGARTEAAERDRLAQDALWQAIADASDPAKVPPSQAGAHVRKAFAAFLAARESANRQRAENPAPAPPSEVCR